MLVGAAWRGRLPLWLTYWVLGVGGNMGLLAVLVLAWAAAGAAPYLLWGLYALSLAWFVFVFGAIWRAAGAYRGPRIWAVLARLGVTVGILRMAAELYLLAGITAAGTRPAGPFQCPLP